jgi:hypothetical protein
MRRASWLLLVLSAACGENLSHTPPPMDHFFFPVGMALTPVAGGNAVAGGNQALLVVSANFDLRYDKEQGATLLSVDPRSYDVVSGTGSLGRPGGALGKLGPGAQLGSYAGPIALADAVTCPGLAAGPHGFVASRYTRKLYQFPVGPDGSIAPCTGPFCKVDLDVDLMDPAAVETACRDDGKRQSLYVGYLRSPHLGAFGAGTAWLSEFDMGFLASPPRTFALGPGPVSAMAFDALTDRLYAVGGFAGLIAPLFILELPPCSSADKPTCPGPNLQTVDLYSALTGADLVGIALSNPQPGRPRRAYISAAVYDEGYAAAIRARPSFDVGGAILVVDLAEDVVGQPAARVRSVVPIGLGAGSVRVLPVRPGLADLVVVPSSEEGSIQLYDDEVGAVVRVVTTDAVSGAPEAGRVPSSIVVEDRGAEALVYVASFKDGTLSVLRVPMADPTSADLLRDGAGKPLRIGSTNQ